MSAIVTGASGGIGQATVAALEAAGHAVAGFDLRGGGRLFAELDVADSAAVQDAVVRVEDALGPVEILVNCAGIDVEVDFFEITSEDLDRMLHVHLGGTYNTCRSVTVGMRERRRGSIVNISSELALAGSAVHAHYALAKGAIVGFTKALAVEFAPDIRVNSVAPGPTDTPMLTTKWRTQSYFDTLPTRALSRADAIGETVAFIASDAAAFITGQIISPNSGTVI